MKKVALCAIMGIMTLTSAAFADELDDGLYKIRSADGNYLTYNAGDKSTTVNVVNAWQWNPINVWWYLRKNAAGGYTISRDYKLETPEVPDYSDALGFDQRFGFEGNIVILEEFEFTHTEAKRWLIEPNGDGSYQIRATDGDGIVLTENGARQATIQTNGGLNTQKWFFESNAEAAAAGVVSAQTQAGTVSFVHRVVDYAIRDYSVDKTGNKYLWYASTLPSVLTFVNKDGSVTVCTSDEKRKTTHIYEYGGDLRERKTLSFQNEFGSLGAFTKDDDGNYYFFYGMEVEDKRDENMAIAKYDRNGRKIKTYRRIAETPHNFSGIQRPFVDGTCRLEISGSMLAVYFAEVDFPGHDVLGQYGIGHQGSHGFIIDKDSFEAISPEEHQPGAANMPSHSHSFNQFILPIDGGFIFADHGDGKDGGFIFARVLRTATGINTRKIRSFVMPGDGEQFFPKKSVLDPTMFNAANYAGMGALAKTSTGYICAGAYGEGISNPRNVFTLTFDDKMITQNYDNAINQVRNRNGRATVEDLKNSLRVPTASPPVYLTKYTREIGHAGHPKMVSTGNGRFLLLWELFRFSAQSPRWRSDWEISGYLSTFALVINEKGEAVSDVKELKGFRLNMNDVLRYNPHNGNVYWAVNNNGKSFTLYALNCNL